MISKNKQLKIAHIVPLVGFRELQLYPPADRVYSLLLEKKKERRRLNSLRHLGALTHALPGIRHTRWDYTVAKLFYASLLCVSGVNSSFKINDIEYSSLIAALQCTALIWNIGHLPGTFAVEKGVYRFLYSQNPNNPANTLEWPNPNDSMVQKIMHKANEFLVREDYLGLSKVLAILKLLKFSAEEEDEWFSKWVVTFAAPVLLDYENAGSHQWEKIRTVFPVVRHCAYLTIDYTISGLNWGPNVPSLLETLVKQSKPFREIANIVSEILSPVERQIYQNLYHNESARKESAILSDRVFSFLKNADDPASLISQWTEHNRFTQLKLGRKVSHRRCNISASLRLRSHFSIPDSAVRIEKELKKKRFELPIASEYRSWNSDVMIEPDEIIIDVITMEQPTANDVGKLMAWCISKFENFTAKPEDEFSLLRKIELESTYLELLGRAIGMGFPDVQVRFQPWPLAQFGIFKDFLESGSKGGIWATNAQLNDPVSKYILRDRSKRIQSKLKEAYAELRGIACLRKKLRNRWRNSTPRHKCLLITGSIRFASEERDLIEYDGGILTVSSRAGKMTLYGLETKSAGTSPQITLQRKLDAIGVTGEVYTLNTNHAYVELPITEPKESARLGAQNKS